MPGPAPAPEATAPAAASEPEPANDCEGFEFSSEPPTLPCEDENDECLRARERDAALATEPLLGCAVRALQDGRYLVRSLVDIPTALSDRMDDEMHVALSPAEARTMGLDRSHGSILALQSATLCRARSRGFALGILGSSAAGAAFEVVEGCAGTRTGAGLRPPAPVLVCDPPPHDLAWIPAQVSHPTALAAARVDHLVADAFEDVRRALDRLHPCARNRWADILRRGTPLEEDFITRSVSTDLERLVEIDVRLHSHDGDASAEDAGAAGLEHHARRTYRVVGDRPTSIPSQPLGYTELYGALAHDGHIEAIVTDGVALTVRSWCGDMPCGTFRIHTWDGARFVPGPVVVYDIYPDMPCPEYPLSRARSRCEEYY